ncbi:MAG: FmdB family transcriptional regulator [Chloroflexi bacterium]|nr:FmdB family transcriptional regulator [Chloroflexota bacterium]MQC27278.1 FmdB family transcriptional regulator [Chloroflexota bacterium]
MPVYTYHCEICGHQFDKQQSFSDSPLRACPACHKHTLRKVYSAAGVVFKGSGFYVTDKRKSSAIPSSTNGKAKDAGKADTKSEGKGAAKPETKKSETKSSSTSSD